MGDAKKQREETIEIQNSAKRFTFHVQKRQRREVLLSVGLEQPVVQPCMWGTSVLQPCSSCLALAMQMHISLFGGVSSSATS